jgi:hypothetical protein
MHAARFRASADGVGPPCQLIRPSLPVEERGRAIVEFCGAAARHWSQESRLLAANHAGVTGSRQRYGMLLVALCATFFFEGVAEPGDVQRAIATILIGGTQVLALYAAELRSRLLRVAAGVIVVLVAGVVIASLTSENSVVVGITSITNGLLVALAPPAVVVGVWRNLRATGTVTARWSPGCCACTYWWGSSSRSCTAPSRTWVAPRSLPMATPPRLRALCTSAS